MAIEDFILKKTQQKDETQAFTLRLFTETVVSIDELASTLGVTRQELVTELVNDSLAGADAYPGRWQAGLNGLEAARKMKSKIIVI